MKKLRKWERKLTAAERKHIKDTTSNNTLREFKINCHGAIGCLECKHIAIKLGTEYPLLHNGGSL